MGKGLPRSMKRGKPIEAPIKKLRLPFTNLPLSVVGASGVGFGAAIPGDLPEGNILVLGAVAYVQLNANGDADIQATFDGDYSIGSAPTADVTLSGAEVDVIPSTALGAATGGLSPRVRGANATQVMLDNTDNSLELNLNVLIDDANISGTASMLASGHLEFAYIVLGDD